MDVWNKAVILKLLWALEAKKDSLWVKWVHVYYIKKHDVLSCPVPISASWSAGKILKLGSLIYS